MINHTLVALMLAMFSSQGECATSFDTQSNQLEFEPIELAPMTISQHTATNKSTPTDIKPGRSPRKQIPSSPAASATNSGLVEPTTYEVNDPRYKRLWGPGLFIIDALADINIGTVKGVQYLVSHRFRSPYTGKITAARPYWTSGSGYAAGNGGKIGVRILPDDGTSSHLPNLAASPIATGIYEPGMLFGRHVLSSFKDSVSLAALEQVVAGKLYHLVYENLASNPAADYLGVNHIVTVEKNGRPARWLGVDDWAALFAFRKAFATPFEWKDVTRTTSAGLYYVPILELTMANGAVFGTVKVEAGNIEGAGQWTITAATPIREQFTPQLDKSIAGLSVHTSTTTGGELEWTLRDGATTLATGTIAEPSANYSSVFNTRISQGVYKWYDIALTVPARFAAGGKYDLELRPKGNSQWRFTDEFNGTEKGYVTAFTESRAQALIAGNWISANHRDHNKASHPSNWRIVLHLRP